MRFQLKTDYALRILIYMSEKKNGQIKDGNHLKITTSELADNLKISQIYMMKILRDLKDAKIVYSIQGSLGGYSLYKDAEDITIYDVVKSVEGKIEIFTCRYGERAQKTQLECPYTCAENCRIYTALEKMEQNVVNDLKKLTVADLCSANTGRKQELQAR